MNNKTIIISESSSDDNLTNFSQNNAQRKIVDPVKKASDTSDYSSFHAQRMNFVKNKSSQRKVHNIEDDFNYIISSSSLVIKQLTHIMNSRDIGSVHDVRQDFIENINMFTETLSSYDIDESEVLVSRYILCTLIDEMINTTYFGKENNWSSNSLLNIFHQESYGGNNFFKLLDKFLKAPAKYIFILEFMYVCLSLGFEGKYRIDNKNKYELSQIRDSLYRQIKIIQGREPLNFYKKHKSSKKKNRLFFIFSYFSIFLTTVLLLVIIYVAFTYALHTQDEVFTSQVEKKYKNLNYLNEKNFDLENYLKAKND